MATRTAMHEHGYMPSWGGGATGGTKNNYFSNIPLFSLLSSHHNPSFFHFQSVCQVFRCMLRRVVGRTQVLLYDCCSLYCLYAYYCSRDYLRDPRLLRNVRMENRGVIVYRQLTLLLWQVTLCDTYNIQRLLLIGPW